MKIVKSASSVTLAPGECALVFRNDASCETYANDNADDNKMFSTESPIFRLTVTSTAMADPMLAMLAYKLTEQALLEGMDRGMTQ